MKKDILDKIFKMILCITLTALFSLALDKIYEANNLIEIIRFFALYLISTMHLAYIYYLSK